MKILIDITHPAHIHFFKNAKRIWEQKSYNICITARKKDIVIQLLDKLGWKYVVLSTVGKGLFSLAKELALREFQLWKIAKDFQPDVMLAIGGIYIAHVGKILGIPALVFTDTEIARISNRLTFPFATKIYTPACFDSYVPPKKHFPYKGYHQLAFTHPTYFQSDRFVLELFGIKKGEPYTVIRTVSWGSGHDFGDAGFSDICEAVIELNKFGKVLISAEGDLPAVLVPYRIQTNLEWIHHLLYFATLYVGESATMAAECATLGTPAILISTSRRGYTNEMEEKYQMVYNFSMQKNRQELALAKAREILEFYDHRLWSYRRQKMLIDTIDLTRLIADSVEEFKR